MGRGETGPPPQVDEFKLNTLVHTEIHGGLINTDAYIFIKGINMTELEGKYLYDIEKTTVECCT